MNKKKFKLENFSGDYAMHCDTEAKANIFCKKLNENGKAWFSGALYTAFNHWRWYKENTCYGFNEGKYADKKCFEREDYTILEFDDFDWEELRKDEGKMKATLKIDGEEIEIEISEEELEKLRVKKVNYAGLERVKDLYEKLTEFAVEHRVEELDWKNGNQTKFFICYDYDDYKIKVVSIWQEKDLGGIYFDSIETAELAIDTFKDELKWYFTEFKDSL